MSVLVEQSPRYEMLGCIAEGATTSLLFARQTSTDGTRMVLVKRLRGEFTFDKDAVAALSEEARLCGLVRHENVVGLADLTILDGALALVLACGAGETLDALVRRARERRERVPVHVAVGLVHGVLRGLEAIHGATAEDGSPASMTHGDVSPQKVFVGTDGVARVADFSTARSRQPGGSSAPDGPRGQVAYQSPEQLLGSATTEKGDVYAAGVVLWELLAGRALYAREDDEKSSAAVLAGPPSPPGAVREGVPSELDAVVMRATGPQAYLRFSSAGDFAKALEPFLSPDASLVANWVRALAAEHFASLEQLMAHPAEADGNSNVSIPGVERAAGSPSAQTAFGRVLASLLARTPFASSTNTHRLQWAVVAALGGVFVVVAFVAMAKSEPPQAIDEPAVEEPSFAAPERAPEPDPGPVTVVTTAPVIEQPAEETSAPREAAPRVPAAKGRATSPASRTVHRPFVEGSSKAASIKAERPTSTPAAPPPSADDPSSLKDYR